MKLNHLNLCVDDLSEAQHFFQNFFGFETLDKKADSIASMSDGHGFSLVLSNPRAFGGGTPVYPDGFHVGFFVDTTDQVDNMYYRLKEAGMDMNEEPRTIRGGYTLYFKALNGILFEVTCHQKAQ
ncbi:VOC family protein [Paenibacillus eucommiae]|uniref:Catechol 2,3-dioxygenase-like lactoylglutathione lyase family enzyme n=1 Tax=Paenibacillus eucommiae TaxID=1355755 RepID=A0ABS4IXH8_9BACL|nr:VOC family protein [Paenibacillus eucommiae]MBP1992250.1 catechol 2,3-dioxygenase-like lactoylglutathione lyase family enzyme [Paenibacillus eucommiae]